jgi:hypothetical protein
MEKINDLAAKLFPRRSGSRPPSRNETENGPSNAGGPSMLSEKHINEVWRRMAKIYGHRWTSSFGEADDGTWLTGLRDLLPEELAVGLRACIKREDDWPPVLPEFRRLCLGYESKGQAIEMALRGGYIEPLPDLMRQMVGSWDLSHKTEKELRAQLANLYADAVSELTAERTALPMDERKLLSAPS